MLLVPEMSEIELPSDVEALRVLVLERDRIIAEHKQTIASLEHKLHVWGKMLWGPRTEKRPVELVLPLGQVWLPFADLLDDAQRLADGHGVSGSIEVRLPTEAQEKPKANPAERLAQLMADEHAETERRKKKMRRYGIVIPAAIVAIFALWVLRASSRRR